MAPSPTRTLAPLSIKSPLQDEWGWNWTSNHSYGWDWNWNKKGNYWYDKSEENFTCSYIVI